MGQKYKISLLIFLLYVPISLSQEKINFKNISINADQVDFLQEKDQILFSDNITIKIDSYLIKGKTAQINLDDEKLLIYGNPASINSKNTEGSASLFIIYPNKFMEMTGNARLLNNGNLLESNKIKYKIASDEK